MLSPDARISLADLWDAGIVLRPDEAVAIVRELLLRVARGELPGVPSSHVIRLDGEGRVLLEGPVAADDRGVPRAAQLLESLLPGFETTPEFRVPGALRLVVARALGTIDLPPYSTLEGFAEALARFSAPDSAETVRTLVGRWQKASEVTTAPALSTAEPVVRVEPGELAAGEPKELTVSDIRRARRATGLSLAEISTKSRVPLALLRKLEWGYLRDWPEGLAGRLHLVQYARAAGLDEALVVRTVWPMVEEQLRARESQPDLEPVPFAVEGEVLSGRETVPWDERPIRAIPSALERKRSRRTLLLAGLAIPALLVLGLLPALWHFESLQQLVPDGRPSVESTDAAAPGAALPRAETVDLPTVPPAEREVPGPSPEPATSPTSGDATPLLARAGGTAEPASSDSAAARPAAGIPQAPAFSPTFASVGSAVFYHAPTDGGTGLLKGDTDGEGSILRITTVVDDSSNNFHARPSPDGRLIAFDSDRDGERAVYLANADGTGVRRVTGPGFAAVPSWSPDGRQLTYVRGEPDKPRVWNLWIVDLETGEERRLTSHPVGQPWGASWFPDGRRIAYSHETRLIVMDLDGSNRRVYASPIQGRLVRTPAVSPDGGRVVFQVFRDGTWLLDLADGSMRKVLSDPSAEEYAWSPDGRKLAYHSRQTGEWGVWVMAPR